MPSTPFAMETCGGILTDQNLRPAVRLRRFLLASDDVPSGYTTKGAQTTGTADSEFYASVPSTVPVWYIHFNKRPDVGQAEARTLPFYAISETIGEVDSPEVATQQMTRIMAAAEQDQCNPDGGTVAIPGSVPGLTAVEGFGGSSAGSLASATVLVAKGPYVVNVMWSSQSLSETATLTQPTAAEIASLVNTALARIPG
jgi:hypothetical protein